MQTSVALFLEKFKTYHTHVAFIWRDRFFSYSFLGERINCWSEELMAVPQGSIVALEADFSPEAISVLFALIELGCIIVPLDSRYAGKNKNKTALAQIDYLININTDDKVSITQVNAASEKNVLYGVIQKRKVPGLVLFTSGSSGEPKAAIHDFSKLLAGFKEKRRPLKTINFLLFDHWGGLNTLFQVLSGGGTVAFLENRTPGHVCEVIEKHGIELLPTSPTFLNMLLLSRAYERHSLKSLQVISYGAEPMPQSLLKHLTTLFPGVKLHQTYGLIELGVMRSQSEGNNSLWVKIGGEGYQTRIIDNMLQIKSESAMLGYLNAGSPFTEDGWFMTGDSVEVKDDYFKILGRKSELINVGGEKVFPQEVENVILEVPGITDVIVYGEKNALTGKIVCAKIKYSGNETKANIIKNIKTHCRATLESFKVPVKINIAEDVFESGRFKKNRNV
jgi:long-chain acyl-CoA synthetase